MANEVQQRTEPKCCGERDKDWKGKALQRMCALCPKSPTYHGLDERPGSGMDGDWQLRVTN